MCMISLIPANVEIPQESLENGADVNRDGHGYAIASAHLGMTTYKSMRFSETMDHLLADRALHGPNSVVLFHSRIGTHGEFGLYNVHPFEVGEAVMAHNGIMPFRYHPHARDRRSDTRVFADWTAKSYVDTPSGVPSRRSAKYLSNIIGTGNKLVFLSVKSGKPAVRLVNSHLGISEGGVWYSNSGFRNHSYSYSRPDWWREDGHWYRNETTVIGGPRDEQCPMCDWFTVDPVANFCTECDYCLDCQTYLDECLCYLPNRFDAVPGRKPSRAKVVDIEDCGDSGWIKVEGIWKQASSLFDH